MHVILVTLNKRTGSGYGSMTHHTFHILQYFACAYVIVTDYTTNTTEHKL